MQVQTVIIEKTAALLAPEERVSIGVLPAAGGMVLQPTGGGQDNRYLSGSARRHLTLQLLCKDTQQMAFDRLAAACRKLETLREFPQITGAQLLNYEAESEPQFVSFESAGGPAIYSAVIYAYYHI